MKSIQKYLVLLVCMIVITGCTILNPKNGNKPTIGGNNSSTKISVTYETLKDMEKNYVIAMSEASNEWLYEIYKGIFNKISDLQRELYLLMFRNGWYQLEPVISTKLDEKYKLLNDDYNGLSD